MQIAINDGWYVIHSVFTLSLQHTPYARKHPPPPTHTPAEASQLDYTQATLMTPPISPATLANRGSVINQRPMATTARPLTSSASCSSSPSYLSSSSSVSMSVVSQPSACSSSYPEFHSLPHASLGFFHTSSSSSSSYQHTLRWEMTQRALVLCIGSFPIYYHYLVF